MVESERVRMIAALVAARGFAAVRDLTEATGASPATLRRDLAKLAAAGVVRRVHVGVEAAGARPRLATSPFDIGQTRAVAAKRAIARAAAALCADGETIIVNAGSTTFQMAAFLRERRLQIVTNSFPMAAALVETSDNRVLIPGGEIYREQGIVLSPFDDDALRHVAACRMFMSAVTVGPLGVIEGDPLIARAEAKLLDRAPELVVLLDSGKFARHGALAVCPLARVSRLITDDAAPPEALAMLRDAGVAVTVVAPDAEDRALGAAA